MTAAFVTYYLIESRTYVTTDNAQIDGNQISISAPTSGILIDWRGQQGAQLQQNAPVGRIEIQGGFMQPQMVIRAPADGVVAVDNGVPGSFVTAGTQLAIAYDGSGRVRHGARGRDRDRRRARRCAGEDLRRRVPER